MTYLDVHASTRKSFPAIFAGFTLFFAGAISIAGLNIFGVRVGFGFVPLLILAVWPRRAETLLSLVFVFFAGLFTDWATGGVTGQWALIFVLVWGFLRPELRSSPFSPMSLFFVWLAICGLTVSILLLSGFFVFSVFPDFAGLGRQMLLASILLPLIMLLRGPLARRFSDTEDWG